VRMKLRVRRIHRVNNKSLVNCGYNKEAPSQSLMEAKSGKRRRVITIVNLLLESL
jgi:hypothetical protein